MCSPPPAKVSAWRREMSRTLSVDRSPVLNRKSQLRVVSRLVAAALLGCEHVDARRHLPVNYNSVHSVFIDVKPDASHCARI
jgi:hypothetical protein